MATIDHITIRGFKSIANLERLPLRNLNVIIGANGAGKSNLIHALELLAHIKNGNLARHVAEQGGADRILHFGSKTSPTMSIEVSMHNGTMKKGMVAYQITLSRTPQDLLAVSEEKFSSGLHSVEEEPQWQSLDGQNGESGLSKRDEGTLDSAITKAWIGVNIAAPRPFHFHDTGATSPMKRTAKLHDNDFLRPDGSNLAAYLYYLKKMLPHKFALIEKTVQRVAPFFDSFILEPLKLDPTSLLLRWKHKSSDDFFDANALSHGTLRFVALATLLVAGGSSIITIDEPELGLHPYAITLLAALMQSAAVENQIIVATQSPLLVDQFSPEDIIVVDQVKGASEFTRFDASELKRLEDWLEDYSLGELWEKNEFGGRPVAF